MIDLAADISRGEAVLQTALVLPEGIEIPIVTDFRAWLKFGRVLKAEQIASPAVLLDDMVPGWAEAAVAFWVDEQEVPHASTQTQHVRAIDMDIDAPLIVAAFWQAYRIDLTDVALSLHWHVFLALLRGLPTDTLLVQVMGWRTWTGVDEKKKPETVARERKARWALPNLNDADVAEALAYQEYWFGGQAMTEEGVERVDR